MPRDGSGIYTTPAGTTAVPDTTIESTKYNNNVADVAADLNAARPIIAGGTGANNATAARDNLDAEVAGVQVTNYATHVFENGSFWSNNSATDKPPTTGVDYYAGTCALVAGGPDCVITAVEHQTGKVWQRRKYGGVWQAWGSSTDDFVNVTGDTMTGNLTINTASPILTFNAGAAGGVTIDSQKSGVSRWQMFLNDGVTETGANAGSNFRIRAIADAGGVIGEAITFNRATLSATFGGPVTVNGAATLAGNLTIAKDLPLITLQDSGTTGSWIVGKKSTGSARWEMALGDPGAGYNFSLTGYNDAGSGIEVLNIKRADGTITSPGPLILKSAGSSVAIGSIVQKIGFAGAEYGMALRPTVDNSYHIAFMNAAASQIGSIFTTPSATQFITSSDERLKEDLKSFDAGNIVDDTNVYDFAWRATGERSYGVIAQQAVEVYPAAVNYSEAQDAWGIDYSKYVPVILQELKALRARVAELEGKLDAKPS